MSQDTLSAVEIREGKAAPLRVISGTLRTARVASYLDPVRPFEIFCANIPGDLAGTGVFRVTQSGDRKDCERGNAQEADREAAAGEPAALGGVECGRSQGRGG